MALLRLDRQQAAELILPGADLGVAFLKAPDQLEPSSHPLALAMEMPLVRLEPTEAVPQPDGGVVVAGEDPDRLWLQRHNGSWRVMPQPWLPLLLR